MIGPRYRWPMIGLLILCLFVGLAREANAADDGIDSIDSALEQLASINALAGDFNQTITDTDGEVISQSQGRFALLRPHFMRWETQAPGQQIVVSDGEFLWQHDLDLETVTRRPLDTRAQTPLRLLVQSSDALRLRYDIELEASRLSFVPKDEPALFAQLSIVLEGEQVTGMTITDNLGQMITIAFQLDADIDLTPEDFAFDVPSEAELFISDN